MKIVVTGGSGFLGQAIVEQLSQQGHDVTSISRGITKVASGPLSVVPIVCDINNTAQLAQCFRKSICVVHCAALSSPWSTRADFQQQNVLGTRSVVEAAQRADVRRLIHVSSSSVYFSFQDKLGIAEDSILPSPVNAYAESKQMAEGVAQKFNGELFIARPRGIFGPGDLHLLPRLLRVMKKGALPLLRNGRAMVDITDVRVVADLICTMAVAAHDQAGVYNVSQGQPIMIRELVERIAKGLAISYRWRTMPIGVAFAFARLLELIARLDPMRREPLVTAYGLGLFGYSHTLDISKARHKLGWQPRSTLAQSLDRTFASMIART